MEYHQDSDYSDEVGAKMESDSCCSGGQCASLPLNQNKRRIPAAVVKARHPHRLEDHATKELNRNRLLVVKQVPTFRPRVNYLSRKQFAEGETQPKVAAHPKNHRRVRRNWGLFKWNIAKIRVKLERR